MLKLNERGLIPAIVQNAESGEVLMMAFMSPESLERTVETGDAWFYSRSREELWHKGETSGNFLRVQEIIGDCDGDTLLLKVRPEGPACHTGAVSCFHNPVSSADPGFETDEPTPAILEELFSVIESRKENPPPGSYTAFLFQEGIGRIAQKVVEEAAETVIDAVQGNKERLPEETADLFYHTLVLLADAGVNPKEVWQALQTRRR
jgi:phosphoribosyl-ATP pyrophosphohydrolase/phosphoribosyl-AMP cyclohydrolase